MRYIVGVDTGGTFTDGVVVDLDTMETIRLKVVTTPYDLTECFMEILRLAAEKLGMELGEFLARCEGIRYSQTIATNTLITRAGTKLGLIVTKGHESDLYSGRLDPPLFKFVEKGMVIGVDEEVSRSGEVRRPMREEEALLSIESLIDMGARAIVVALKNSYINPVHERLLRVILRREYPPQYLGRVPTFLSHEVARIRDDYVRVCSAVIDAYVHRRMATYLYKAEDNLRENRYERPLMLVNSDGALSRVAWTKALSTIGSGPAAGVIGAYTIASKLYGMKSLVTLDLGGTSLDIGLVRGDSPMTAYYSYIEGVKLFQPMVNVQSVAVGGGSIVRVSDRSITIGPDSAGSSPGPACFDRGGEDPTPTDANLILGYLNPRNFLGGRIDLSLERAREAIRSKVADKLGVDVLEASYLIREAVNKKIADSLSSFLDAHGIKGEVDAYFYGGGGPLHACAVMSSVRRIGRVYVFPYSSEFSALGCCLLDVGHHYYREVGSEELSHLGPIVDELMDRARRDVIGEGFSLDSARFQSYIYVEGGGEYVPISGDLKIDSSGRSGPLILSVRWTIASEKPKFERLARYGPDPGHALKGRRGAYWRGLGTVDTPVYELSMLRHGNVVEGPAIIESDDSTIVIEPGYSYLVDEFGNGLVLRLDGGLANG